jgi:hypothetical protein
MHLKAAAAVSALALLALGAGTTATAGGTTLHLGGSWAGTYSGAVSGKFTLTWTQTNGRLKGVIKLGAIYNGSVSASGLKMSGTWASGPGGGTWSAHKLLTVVKIKLP